jgi:hypothetical protein
MKKYTEQYWYSHFIMPTKSDGEGILVVTPYYAPTKVMGREYWLSHLIMPQQK